MKKVLKEMEIKKGDIVRMVIPKGKRFEVGGSSTTGFNGGIVPPMIDFARGKEYFEVKKVDEDILELVGSPYSWDITWFEKRVEENTKEEKKEMKCEFKVGDKVRLVVPRGKEFKAGVTEEDFKGCITETMVDIVKENKTFEIEEIIDKYNVARFKGYCYVWDLTWFKKVEELEEKREMLPNDKIRLSAPRGKVFRQGETGFEWGIVEEMVEIIQKHEGVLTVMTVKGNLVRVKEDGGFFSWDKKWFEVVDRKEKVKPIIDEIKLEYQGRSTKATFNGKTGRAYRSEEDVEDRKVGVLIATMKALGFDEKMVEKVVDVIFDDVKELEDYTLEELLKEVASRLA